MYGERIGEDAQTKTHLSLEAFLCRFSIFYCGCKQPKSVHILKNGANLRLSEGKTKGKALFPTTRWEYFLNAS